MSVNIHTHVMIKPEAKMALKILSVAYGKTQSAMLEEIIMDTFKNKQFALSKDKHIKITKLMKQFGGQLRG